MLQVWEWELDDALNVSQNFLPECSYHLACPPYVIQSTFILPAAPAEAGDRVVYNSQASGCIVPLEHQLICSPAGGKAAVGFGNVLPLCFPLFGGNSLPGSCHARQFDIYGCNSGSSAVAPDMF